MSALASRGAGAALIAGCLLMAPTSRAQLPPPAADASASRGEANVAVPEAERRRLRAIQHFDEGALDAALLEFQRAYELAPAHRLLYNMALVCLRLHDYAAAIGYFERYLHDGADSIEPERRRAVQAKVAEVLPRVAVVHVNVNVAGARVSVDDRVVGTSPLLEPLRLNPGFHRVSAQAQQRLAVSHGVELTGGDRTTIDLALVQPRRDVPWLAWGGTALLAGGAAWAGVNAVSARHDFERKRAALGVTRESLARHHDRALHWSVAADALGVAAVGLGVYALITSSSSGDEPLEPTSGRFVPGTFELEIEARGVAVKGVF